MRLKARIELENGPSKREASTAAARPSLFVCCTSAIVWTGSDDVTSAFMEIYVYGCPQGNTAFTIRCVNENIDSIERLRKMRYDGLFQRLRVGGRPKRIKKYAFTNVINVYVLTGPQSWLGPQSRLTGLDSFPSRFSRLSLVRRRITVP